MLKLKQITKNYTAGDTSVQALKGIELEFRKNEFVSILGPSGCGKTTLLNIIGGLDRYTSGDLQINGTSTKEYQDVNWDIYRNNSIGFVFQNYNLIPHQTVLSNVELAMTLAGVSREERRKRAIEALEKVGLDDQLHKKPNQVSGGQAQRVAIARALVNNPDILLADEPTGALDSETSVQIMNILKEIAQDRLIIMVTHNAELAQESSTRIIRLLDGKVISDSNPYKAEEKIKLNVQVKKRKVSMRFFTALSLSLNNLTTKKARTILTAFAGSIGIIGIALIISLSSGMQVYINNIEKDTLSTYPIEIQSQSTDMSGMMSAMMKQNSDDNVTHDLDKVYSNNIMSDMMSSTSAQITKNDLKQFKGYLESDEGQSIARLTNSIKYGYDLDLQIYKSDMSDGILQVNPNDVYSQMGTGGGGPGGAPISAPGGGGTPVLNSDVWTEMLGNSELLSSQYDVAAGLWPSAYNEIVLVLDKNNELSDTVLYSLGISDQNELSEMKKKIQNGEKIDKSGVASFTYDELLGQTFKLILNTDYYQKDADKGVWVDKHDDQNYMRNIIENATELKIVGIIRPNQNVSATSISGSVGYTSALTDYVINAVNNAQIVKEQKADHENNVFTGFPFDIEGYMKNMTTDDINAFVAQQPEDEQAQARAMMANMSKDEAGATLAEQIKTTDATYESNLSKLGVVEFDNPSSINLYPLDFTAKEEITSLIDDYNTAQRNAGHDEYVIRQSDMIGLMISSVSSIINIISYVLIAFVAISLVVSSIMIGIITYISVLERTKEIGILRSIGASKRDISRVFNAETVIVGLVAGVLGIGITLLLNIPLNLIIKSLVGVSGIAALPIYGAVGLILTSMLLTVIAGLIPSRVAAKKDPVEALRTE